MTDISPAPGHLAFPPVPSDPPSIVELVRLETLDAELTALLWLLVESRVPIVVAAEARGAGASMVLAALLDFLPPDVRLVALAGEDETFAWLPQASELGWSGAARPTQASELARAATTVQLAGELSDGASTGTAGDVARIAVRAASVGYGLAATVEADSLEDVFEALRRPPIRLTDDELSHLGVVLVLRQVDAERRRVVAAHYVRPIARDTHGHLQRLGPAVLATWDPTDDAFEHFGWGVIPELALRTGHRAGDFEAEVDRRREYLADLVATGVTAPDDVRAAIRAYGPATAFDAPVSDA